MTRVETIGRLKCRIVDQLSGAVPRIVVILSHGYGASGSDLVPIGQELLDQVPQLQENVQFVFPEAPLALDEVGLPGGRAWWPIDMVRLQLANATGRYRELRQECPSGLPEARAYLTETLTALQEKTGLPLSQFVIGGFSQGAMLSTDTALHLEQNVAALVAMSGTLLHEPEWKQLAAKHSDLRVLQSHGTEDPILPFDAAKWLRDLLQSAGANLEFIPFAGGHQIPFEVFEGFAVLLQQLVSELPD
jgi:phospholipase/carboxylesterase